MPNTKYNPHEIAKDFRNFTTMVKFRLIWSQWVQVTLRTETLPRFDEFVVDEFE